MPAQRLPWIKFWPEALEHEKFAALTDGQRWTWVAVWAKASLQPRRWRFASVEHAAMVTGRPAKDIRKLIELRLIDECDDGIWMHNVRKWQERYPSEPSANPPSTPVEDTANVPETPAEDTANDTEICGETSLKKKKESKRENIGGTSASADPPKAPNRSAQVIDSLRAASLEPTFTSRDHAAVKQSTAPPGLIAEVYGAVFRGEYGDDFMRKRLSVHEAIEWINGYQAWRSQGSPPPARLSLTNGRAEPPRHIVDRTGAPT